MIQDFETKQQMCPLGEIIWKKYRQENTFGRQSPPASDERCTDPDLAIYCDHIRNCEICR